MNRARTMSASGRNQISVWDLQHLVKSKFSKQLYGYMKLIGINMNIQKKLALVLIAIVVSALSITAYLYRAVLIPLLPNNNSDIAEWVGALGSVGAVFSAIWIMHRQHIASEQLIIADRAHATQKEVNEKVERISVCLLIAGQTATGIISVLGTLEKVREKDLPWMLDNQAKFIAQCSGPTLCIPLHELGSIDLVRLIYDTRNLAQRLTDCINHWGRSANNPSSYALDLKQTVNLLKPEADALLATIEQFIKKLVKETGN